MKKIALLLILFTSVMWSNNLNITNIVKVSDTELQFDVSWDNSWNDSGFNDAAWVFVKVKDYATEKWLHLEITNFSSAEFTNENTLITNRGFMIKRISTGIGSISGTINFEFANTGFGPFPDFKIFGIEMVYVNEGEYYLGDTTSERRFYNFDNGDALPFLVTAANGLNGIASLGGGIVIDNPVVSSGFLSFYIMKYETTQEQYATFLNTLTIAQQQTRTASNLLSISASNRFVMSDTGIPTFRNAIACDDNAIGSSPINFYCDLNNNGIPNEANDGQNIACNYLSINDGLSYLDWAALRAIGEPEYEKAARGFVNITPGAFANGTTIAVESTGITNFGQADETVVNIGTDGLTNYNNGNPIRVGLFSTATSNRLQSGGSYFGVMDLTGNLIEYTIEVSSDSLDLSYYSEGNGELDINGNYDNFFDIYDFNLRGGRYNTTNSSQMTVSHRNPSLSPANHNIRTYHGCFRGVKRI